MGDHLVLRMIYAELPLRMVCMHQPGGEQINPKSSSYYQFSRATVVTIYIILGSPKGQNGIRDESEMEGQQEKMESDINMSLVKDKSDGMRLIVGDVTVCSSRNVEAQ